MTTGSIGGLVLAIAIPSALLLLLNILVVIEALLRKRALWWVYIFAIPWNPAWLLTEWFAPRDILWPAFVPLGLFTVLVWFAWLRRHPIMKDGAPFL